MPCKLIFCQNELTTMEASQVWQFSVAFKLENTVSDKPTHPPRGSFRVFHSGIFWH